MSWDKDIRFPDKKVDDSWKETIDKDKRSQTVGPASGVSAQQTSSPKKNATLKPFLNLISSLGFQAMLHLGEMTTPDNPEPEVNLEAAKEIIELISAVKLKTENNRSPEEDEMLNALLAQLQMKFAQKV